MPDPAEQPPLWFQQWLAEQRAPMKAYQPGMTVRADYPATDPAPQSTEGKLFGLTTKDWVYLVGGILAAVGLFLQTNSNHKTTDEKVDTAIVQAVAAKDQSAANANKIDATKEEVKDAHKATAAKLDKKVEEIKKTVAPKPAAPAPVPPKP